MRRRFRFVLLALAVGIVSVYVTCFTDAHRTVARDGWQLDFAYRRFACEHCFGKIEALNCNGKSVRLPTVDGGEGGGARLTLYTPVGIFSLAQGDQLRFISDSVPVIEQPAVISSEDLKRGYYEMLEVIGRSYYEPLPRRGGTPVHWCVAHYLGRAYWVNPDALCELTWR